MKKTAINVIVLYLYRLICKDHKSYISIGEMVAKTKLIFVIIHLVAQWHL